MLSDRDQAVLDIEKRVWKHLGVKEETIRRELDLTATAYYQILHKLLYEPDAWACAPQVLTRLQAGRRQRAHRGVDAA